MIGCSTGRALPNCSELASFVTFSIAPTSTASSSKSDLNLATEAKLRNAINDKTLNAPYTSRTSANIWHLASPPARPIGKMTGILSNKDVEMSELRRKGVPRGDLKIIASDPDLAAITKDVEALNDA
jgi:hypothetical protein